MKRSAAGVSVWDQIDGSDYPDEVRKVSSFVSALPTTQVTVERMFSQLKLVMRDNRARMGAKLIEALIFLRTNKCV